MSEEETLFRPILKVIKGVTWQTEGSLLLASTEDRVFGKKLAERYLFRTPNGAYFEQYHQGGIKGKLSNAEIHPLSEKEALKKYEAFQNKLVSFGEAFPNAPQA